MRITFRRVCRAFERLLGHRTRRRRGLPDEGVRRGQGRNCRTTCGTLSWNASLASPTGSRAASPPACSLSGRGSRARRAAAALGGALRRAEAGAAAADHAGRTARQPGRGHRDARRPVPAMASRSSSARSCPRCPSPSQARTRPMSPPCAARGSRRGGPRLQVEAARWARLRVGEELVCEWCLAAPAAVTRALRAVPRPREAGDRRGPRRAGRRGPRQRIRP